MEIFFKPIGRLVTPFDQPAQMPIQPCSKTAGPGYAIVEDRFISGLKYLDTFSHVILIYHFHKQVKAALLVKPFLDREERGIFATRAPARPNAIGLSVVKLIRIEDNKLYFDNLDVLDGTPLLDIKPYVPEFDIPENPTSGWLAGVRNPSEQNSDSRFV